jgi:hypothetical protein
MGIGRRPEFGTGQRRASSYDPVTNSESSSYSEQTHCVVLAWLVHQFSLNSVTNSICKVVTITVFF